MKHYQNILYSFLFTIIIFLSGIGFLTCSPNYDGKYKNCGYTDLGKLNEIMNDYKTYVFFIIVGMIIFFILSRILKK